MKMDINLGHGSGSRSKGGLNVFAQLTEPKAKDGIWIKTQHVTSNEPKYNNDIPYDFYNGSAVAIGTNIYLFGSSNSPTISYKYDTLTDAYTKLKNIPFNFYDGNAVAIGTDIYLFGSDSSLHRMKAYKYDTLTDTYTQLTNVPYDFCDGSAVAIGTDIYLFGSSYATYYYKTAYKYDTLTDTYTQLTDIPCSFYSGSAVVIGTDIYLLGGEDANAKYNIYRYNILTNKYTLSKLLTDKDFYDSSAVAIGTDIYLLGTYGSKLVRKYDTLTGEITTLENIPYTFYRGFAVVINADIYLLGGFSERTKNYIYGTYKEYEEINKYDYNKLVIVPKMPTTPQNGNIYALYGNTYNAKLLEKEILNFMNVFLYKDGETQLYPIYLGNGQEWVKILN